MHLRGTSLLNLNTVYHLRLPLAGKDVLEEITQAPVLFSKSHHFLHLNAEVYLMVFTVVWREKGREVTCLTSKRHAEGTEQRTLLSQSVHLVLPMQLYNVNYSPIN